ncbi:hypothetical protein DR864_00305 [Runella rosea]|uniref:Uncharacterized protein n=1 Tax=Runella rosea TaxID=2259595 RepID=A0A344TC47_9BACT|nr:hypothetical protein [Runella rosea]AXE16218.1 hypothetical protein DR864_00025 [Runella rosea]AXE16274.1 hypothetical protein DR864_00305 [Runella rosea]
MSSDLEKKRQELISSIEKTIVLASEGQIDILKFQLRSGAITEEEYQKQVDFYLDEINKTKNSGD